MRAGLSASDAADCFQQTWVALYQNRRKLRDPSRSSSWLVTTARRETLRLRHQAGRSGDEDNQAELADRHPLPDEELMILERQAQLEVALKELDPRCRELIELFFFAPGERTYEQIASSLNLASNDSTEADLVFPFPAHKVSCIAVAALDSLNIKADFSNYGDKVDICAPGTRIYSTFLDTSYAWWDGTSFAAPFVIWRFKCTISAPPASVNRELTD